MANICFQFFFEFEIHLQALTPSSNMQNPFCSSITSDDDNVNWLLIKFKILR